MMRRQTNLRNLLPAALVLFLLPLLLFPLSCRAETAEEKGLAIATEADARDSGYGDLTADMLMVLRNRHGQESRRAMRYRVLEVENDGDKSLTIFDSPRDVKGTAFLNYTHKVGDDDQWLYLPALKRVKRISSRNKSGSFMGSEFSYEDISSQEVEKYSYKWLRDERCDSMACHVIERYPVDRKNSGYSRQVAWIDKKEYRTWKVEYFDRKNSHLKTLAISGYEKYSGRFWRAAELHMVNHRTGKSTVLQFGKFRFGTGLDETDFSKNSLKRVK
jgi:outer membrane lipoprotein-sorting protein